MKDIVERLRERQAFGLIDGHWQMLVSSDEDCRDAADEIERLTMLLEYKTDGPAWQKIWMDDKAKLRAEVEQLRAALQKIADYPTAPLLSDFARRELERARKG